MSPAKENLVLCASHAVTVNARGAIRIPSDWREFFSAGREAGVVMMCGPGPAIWIYPGRSGWMLREIDERHPPDGESRSFHAQFGPPCNAILTSRFTVTLPKDMRRRAALENKVILCGCYDHLEVMTPAVFRKINGKIQKREFKQAVREMGF